MLRGLVPPFDTVQDAEVARITDYLRDGRAEQLEGLYHRWARPTLGDRDGMHAAVELTTERTIPAANTRTAPTETARIAVRVANNDTVWREAGPRAPDHPHIEYRHGRIEREGLSASENDRLMLGLGGALHPDESRWLDGVMAAAGTPTADVDTAHRLLNSAPGSVLVHTDYKETLTLPRVHAEWVWADPSFVAANVNKYEPFTTVIVTMPGGEHARMVRYAGGATELEFPDRETVSSEDVSAAELAHALQVFEQLAYAAAGSSE